MFPADVNSPTEYALSIDFEPHSPDPSRVFTAMTGLIQACEDTDRKLAHFLEPIVVPVLYLETIETGSITARLRSVLQAVDDDALKSLDWKKAVGAYLVKGKRRMIEFLGNRDTIESREQVQDLQTVIHEAAQETKALELPQYSPLPALQIAESLMEISNATAPLNPSDRARFISTDGTSEINTRFRVTPERIEEVLTHETIVSVRPMIMKVKKPDFLGDSMWDFRLEGRKLSAKVLDQKWLTEFHKGKVPLHPGDCLRGAVEETAKYGADGEVIAIHYRVLEVQDVLRSADSSA